MTYPKTVTLRNGTEVTLVEKKRDDLAEMAVFFKKLSFEDRLYLRRDITNSAVLEARARELTEGKVIRISAYVGNELVGE